MGLPERLAEMQRRLAAGDATARQVFVSVGRYLGYAIAHLADGYDLRHILVLGRVTSGEAGGLLVAEAESVLRREFPDLSERVSVRVPGEQERRHGQAVVAASLPRLAHPVPPAEKKGP
jgi:predicted NBD/HSP70 family sugar kinase